MSNIQKRPNGKWRARFRDASGRQHARHFDRKTDAERWRDEQIAALVTGQFIDPSAGRISFDDYFTSWSSRQVWEPTTRTAMDLARRSVTFGNVPMASLRASHVETAVKAMVARGLAPGTIRTRVNNVRTALRAAVRDRVIATDPSEGVTLPRVRRTGASMVLPTDQQVGQLLEASEDRFRAFVAVAAFSGLRLGETAALQVGDINFLRHQLRVRRQVQRLPGGAVDIRLPKYGSERTVYLADDLCEVLSEHIGTYCPEGDQQRWLFAAMGPRRTRTPSATCGARPGGPRGSRRSLCTHSVTTTRRA